ncbi:MULTISPECIES: cupin domain-containing protein [Rhodopseudomonas]|uniref:Cupin n=1 Tax=Rhodopseudomonas palustris TaxID=1076 RepID=A0A0D7DZC8_RHOPL|nr:MULTISPECIES: cupin domain-containing protein [Rhodopseudomonas]KIZ33565.1 cupin [Rhodopseudomonas palustris]MDF3813266.1 cupin domain-containing protein [Rhodopseudomonas sp. BAL398]WOK17576.1 cupin domain-containing protein [Rhodopseudomonas sp. BAL398]
MRSGHLLGDLPAPGPDESLETLLSRGDVRIERIVSTGQASPPGFWYDQSEHEFVVLLAGAATLRFEEGDRVVALTPGSYLEIPAHCRHRVEATQSEQPTVWLALFCP